MNSNQLPETFPSVRRSQNKEMYFAVGLIVLGLFFVVGMLGRHARPSHSKALASIAAMNGKKSIPLYQIHIKTVSLDTLDKKTHHFPKVASLIVDGKTIQTKNNPRNFDGNMVMPAGSHKIVIRMWDDKKQMSEKDYVIQVGKKLSLQVAKN